MTFQSYPGRAVGEALWVYTKVLSESQGCKTMSEGKTIIPIANGDFEAGETGWVIAKDCGDCGITTEHAASGTQGLRIIADKARNGAKVEGPMTPCQGPGIIELHAKVRVFRGRHLGLWVREYDADGAMLPSSQKNWGELGGSDGEWRDMLRQVVLDEKTAALQLFFKAYPQEGETIEVYIDDLKYMRLEMRIPPWPSEYKLKPGDQEKLTAAGVVGPDGVVYPNWRQVGVKGGIPDVPVVLALAELGAKPETDISGLLQQAAEQVGEKGGGAILIGEGTFYLDRPVSVAHSKVVIRGSGRDGTRLVFRYSIVNPAAALPQGWPPASVFTFGAGGMAEAELRLAADGKRGDTALQLEDTGNLQVGDRFVLRAPVTERWQAITRDRCKGAWGTRSNQYEVHAIEGNTIAIGEALRIDFPVADGSNLRKADYVEYCGLESMTIEHACRMRFDTLTSLWAWDCWACDLSIIDAGCSGVHFRAAKRCELRDCEVTGFDPAVHKAHDNWWCYAGFTQTADCLMDNTVWHRARHGPQVQFGAQGNVIRNSVFEGSDAQWHAGWSTENLFENCTVNSYPKYGSYGYGAYATGSDDTSHGPNGPRNVVYNCDLKSAAEGVMLRGANENWLFLHNRIVVEKGAGFAAICGSFDHIIRGNTFVLHDDDSPMLHLKTPDCVGVELLGNQLYGGNGTVYQGTPKLDRDEENQAHPAAGETLPARPTADPPSIFDWQRRGK